MVAAVSRGRIPDCRGHKEHLGDATAGLLGALFRAVIRRKTLGRCQQPTQLAPLVKPLRRHPR